MPDAPEPSADARVEMERRRAFAEALLSDDPAARPEETEAWDRYAQLCLAILDLLFPLATASRRWISENLGPGMGAALDIGDMEDLLRAVLDGDEALVTQYLDRVTEMEREEGERMALWWPRNPGCDERRVGCRRRLAPLGRPRQPRLQRRTRRS